MHMSTLVWIALVAGVAAIVAVWLFFGRVSATDLGSVSSHWIVEHRDGPD